VRDGNVNAAIVVPPGFSVRSESSRAPDVEVLARPDQLLGEGIARAVADGFMAHVDATRMAVATTASVAPTPSDGGVLAAVAQEAASIEAVDVLADRTPGRAVPPATYYAPAMAILFAFFLAGFGARSFLAERRDNTMARMLAAPVPRGAVIAGKALATFVVGFVSLLVMYLASSVAFHANWGNPVAVVALCASTVASVMAVTALVTTFARTDDQANGYTGIVTFVFGLVGGNFIATYQLPSFLRKLSELTPNGWALRGFSDLAAGTGVVAAVALPLAAVGAFTLVCGGRAMRRAPALVAA
jgi:ABC-2 type transport system permease protein